MKTYQLIWKLFKADKSLRAELTTKALVKYATDSRLEDWEQAFASVREEFIMKVQRKATVPPPQSILDEFPDVTDREKIREVSKL